MNSWSFFWLYVLSLQYMLVPVWGIDQLSDIFQVDMRNPEHFYSSCAPYFDPDEDPAVPSQILNKIWHQIDHVLTLSVILTTREHYNERWDTRKLLSAFFAIRPAQVLPSSGTDFEPNQGWNIDKMQIVRQRFADVSRFTQLPKPDGFGKPKLFCDSSFMKFQRATDWVKDRTGAPIVKDVDTGELWTLPDWEQQMGRNFNDYWYFWADSFQSGYMIYPKHLIPSTDEHPGLPFNIDPRTGDPSSCTGGNAAAEAWSPMSRYRVTHEFSLMDQVIYLCPDSFETDEPEIDYSPQPEGTTLDSMAITALTFYHELFHLVYPNQAPDSYVHKPAIDEDGNVVETFPLSKESFHNLQEIGRGALHCLCLALYDSADPVVENFNHLTTIYNPESYVWFSFALALQYTTGQDWSTCVTRPGGSSESMSGPYL